MSPETRRRSSSAARRSRWQDRAWRWIGPLALGVAGALAFTASLPGGRFVFDDHVLIEKNSDLPVVNPEKNIDLILEEIQKELDQGIKFLCKTDIYYNGTRLFKFGYYHKKNGEYKYTEFNITKNKVFYKKLVALLIDNCILDLP